MIINPSRELFVEEIQRYKANKTAEDTIVIELQLFQRVESDKERRASPCSDRDGGKVEQAHSKIFTIS